MPKKTYTIVGNIVNAKTRKGLAGLQAEAWGEIRKSGAKGKTDNKELGRAVTKKGAFSINIDHSLLVKLSGGVRSGNVFFKVYDSKGDSLLPADNKIVWRPASPEPVMIELNVREPDCSSRAAVGKKTAADSRGMTSRAATAKAAADERRERELSAETQKYILLQTVLEKRLPDEASRIEVARVWVENRRNPAQFMARIAEKAEWSSLAEAVRFTLEVTDRIGLHPELIAAMGRRFDTGEFREPGEIARWEANDWEDFLRKEKIAIPDSFSKDDSNASVRAFAKQCRSIFESAYPNQAVRSHFDRHAASYAWGEAVRELFRTIPDLDASIPVVRLEREQPKLFGGEEGLKARRGLATFQRLHRLTQRLDPIQALVRAGFNSARAIARTDPADFAKRFAPAFDGGIDEAAATHARAARASALAKLTFSALSDQFNRRSLAVLDVPEPAGEQGQAFSTWCDLFGSEDLGFCDCFHCKSIFGPAAYLFDMLLFLDRFAAPPRKEGLITSLPEGWPREQQDVRRATALTILNCVEQPEQLVDWVRDDPAYQIGSENTIGVSIEMANAILQEREALGGRFSSLQQVYDIDGIGPDTLHDIIHTSWGETGPMAVDLALKFLNSATSADEICREIKDDPGFGRSSEQARGVPLDVAQRILSHRDSAEVGGAYAALSQVADVPGVGPDTLHDIIYSFYEKVGQRIIDGEWIFAGPGNNVVALAEFNGRLFGATSDHKLLMRDALPEDLPWHVIGYIKNVAALTISPEGRLIAATDRRISMSDLASWVSGWTEIGQANSMVALASLDEKLYAVSGDNKLWMRDPAPTDVPWTQIGHADYVVGLTALDGKLYAATSDNKLWIRDPDPTDLPWTHIGHADNVVGLTAMDGKLYAATSDNKLLVRDPDPVDLPWSQIGRTEQVAALAAAGGLLFAATVDHRLLMRGAASKDRPWVHIGEARNVAGMTSLYGKLYAVTGDNKLVLKQHPPMEVPLTLLVDADNIKAVTYYQGILYAATSDNELVSRQAVPSNAPWSNKGTADRVVTMASQQGRFVIVNGDNRILVRNVAPADAPWTDSGDARGTIAVAATDAILFAVNGDNELWMREFPVWETWILKSRTLLDKFRLRRPDVPALPLSCDNTNIEVPHIDLVNELLADLVHGALCFGMDQTEALLHARSTTGTSEERRAWPEHKPARPVLIELKKAGLPWTLPYDYERDHAEQARRALPVEGNDVIEAVWRFEALQEAVDGATTPLTHAWPLAQHALNLTEAEIGLISMPGSGLPDTWGDEVAGAVAAGMSPTVAALQRAGRFDFPALEDAIETRFVRQAAAANAIRIKPAGFCDPEKLRLDASVAEIPTILDHLHRFERLRRKCGWSAVQLDSVLGAVGYALGKEELLVVGLMLFLQQRLRLSPDAVLALFRDPVAERPFKLRSDKRVLSSFERLFGTEPVSLPVPAGDIHDEARLADILVASIGARAGTGPDEVRYVFSMGCVKFDGTPITDPLAILSATDPLAAWRSAVAGVFRVATFAAALGLSLADLFALDELSSADPLLRSGTGDGLARQLVDAVDLINLAREAGEWPIPASEVLYLTTADDFASRVHGPDAIRSGNLLLKLTAEVRRMSEALQGADASAVATARQALMDILGEAVSLKPDGQSIPEKAIDRIQRMIEWSSVFPVLKARAVAELPAGAVLGTEVPDPDAAELADAAQAWSEVLDIANSAALLPELLRRHCSQIDGATNLDESGSEYRNVLQKLRDETEAMVREPGLDGVTRLSDAIQPLLALTGVPATDLEAKAKALAGPLLSAAALSAASRMETRRVRATAPWIPALVAAASRIKLDSAVIEQLAAAFSLDAVDARMLLTQLLLDPDQDQALLRAFVSRDGRMDRVADSLVQALYVNQQDSSGLSSTGGVAGATTTTDAELVVARTEPCLQLDWAAAPPPPGINAGRFQVTLKATAPAAAFKTGSGIRRLFVESTGQVAMSLHAVTGEALVLEQNAAGRLERQEWDHAAAEGFFASSAPDSDETVRIVVTFVSAPETGPGSGMAFTVPPVLRVLAEAGDGELVPFTTGTLANALTRLDKAARMVRGMSLPEGSWMLLAGLQAGRRVDLNDLPLPPADSTAFELWERVISLQRIWKRRHDAADGAALQSIATGSAVSIDALGRALGLARTELADLLQVLGIPVESSGTEASLALDWRAFDAALRLSDLARKTGLPLAAIVGWITASPRDFYQWSLGALRAQRPENEWLRVLGRIHDPVRENLRDALIAWLVTHERTGADGLLHPPFSTPEAVSDHLFTDVQMSACLASSRVQFGYAAVQRYIDALRLGFEQGPEEAEAQERFEREWTWRRFYRLWEANRRVFAFPENWLEPDLRPDKTQFFRELEEELLEGPLTTQSAENALVNYLGKLVDVARPEIVGIIHENDLPDENSPLGFRDPDLQGTHVFGRSRSQPHQLYYRRRMPAPDNRWTPWERVEAELPGTHFIPVIAFRRLYLFCAQFGSGRVKPANCACDGGSAEANKDPRETGFVELSWIQRRHGRWTQVCRSEPIEFDVSDVQYTGDDIDAYSGFPAEAFPEVSHEEPVLTGVTLTIGVTDGMNPNHFPLKRPRYTYLKAYVWTKSGLDDIFLGYLYGDPGIENSSDIQHAGWPAPPPNNTNERSFDNLKSFSCLVSNVEGIKLVYHGCPPQNDYGDACEIVKVECQFKTDSEEYDDLKVNTETHRLDPPNADDGYRETSLRIPFKLEQDPAKDYYYNSPGVIDYFESELVKSYFDPPPPEVYALHLTEMSGTPDSIVFHLTVQEDIAVCCRQVRRYRFTEEGFDHFDEMGHTEIRGNWPTGWQLGSEGCTEQRTKFQYLRRIEVFSDGTVRPVERTGENIDRGTYEGTTPWRQFFIGNFLPTYERYDFFTDGQRAVWTHQPYQIAVENRSNITSVVSPKILDEVSEILLGRTLFVERVHSQVWAFRVFWHPQAVGFLRLLQGYGIPRFLSHGAQTLVDPALVDEKLNVDFFNMNYNPTPGLVSGSADDYPSADVDFSIKGAYSDYNWELFFHAPLLIAQRLSEAGQFDESERWFKLLFDPSRGRLNANPLESFQTRPLREATARRLEDMLHLLNHQEVRSEFAEQVDRLNRYPYQPHLIARCRLTAYQKTLVMKYLDHLIAWGDELFRRAYASDNRTDLENAGSRYDLAAKLLGRRPEVLPAQSSDAIFSYDELREDKEELDLWDPLIRIENYMPGVGTGRPGQVIQDSGIGGSGRPGQVIQDSGIGGTGRSKQVVHDSGIGVPNDGEGIPEYLYFCVPHNDELLKYWDTLADRLSKLRSCRDIEGVRRTLSLYGRRIDPGLLVRATAMGLDVDVLLGYLSAPLPRFRFNAYLQRARGACDRAQAFGQALLSAIEKRESEELVRLRSKHEVALLRAAKRVRDEQVSEAAESLEALRKSRESAEARYRFYSTRKRLNARETAEGKALEEATKGDLLAAAASSSAADLAFVPDIPASFSYDGEYDFTTTVKNYLRWSAGVKYDFGGTFLSKIEENKARGHRQVAERNRTEAARIGREAQHDRRWDDWQLQKELAEKDMIQIDRQITSAEIRVRIAEIEQENQSQQIDQAVMVDAYLRDKFTNAKLYRWMETRLSRLYYQQYRLAYDLALKAQRAMRYELGLDDDSLLPDSWDPSRRGMEAASDLQHELEKLETRYMDSWRREHEKQKTFSLADRRPLEFLELRQTGSCVIRIMEHEFDEDEPGDYFRRIKQVSVSIPCVVGPDVSVNARLTLLRSEIRLKPHSGGSYARAEGVEGAGDGRFRDYSGGAEHIVTSTGVNDTGQFDAGLGGDRLLPFEGAGVISTWRIDLPKETNHFDRAGLADVKLRILYTARDGGDAARSSALAARNDYLRKAGREVLIPLASCFSNAWARFTGQNTAPRELELEFRSEHLPFALRGPVTLAGVNLYFEFAPGDELILNAGVFDYPLDLDGIARYTPESSVNLGDTLRLTLASNSAVPRKGWAVLIVKSTT